MSDAPTAGTRSLTGIEVGRGIAATLVVLYHVSRHLDYTVGAPSLRTFFQFGHAGVDFFFVISGFIILFVHYRDIGNPAHIGRYIRRRFTRLMPTYWVALALTIAMQTAGSRGVPSLSDLFWSISLVPSNHELLLGIAWTLRFEITFYTLFCILISSYHIGLAVIGIWFFLVLSNIVIGFDLGGMPHEFYAAYDIEFFLGMAAAYFVTKCKVRQPWFIALTGMVLFGAAALGENLGLINGYEQPARLAYGIPSALIVLGIASEELRQNLRVPRLLRLCGTASYSIYIFQFVFIGCVWQGLLALHLSAMLPVGAQFVILSAAGIGGGIIMSLWVEHPLIEMVRGRRQGAVRVGSNPG